MEAIINIIQKHLTPDKETIIGVLASFVIWNLINFIVMSIDLPDKHLSRKDYLDLRNRMSSLVHGLIALALSGYHTFFLAFECGGKNSDFDKMIMMTSVGYFIYDLVVMAYFRLLDLSMFIHHMICITGLYITLCEGKNGGYLIAALFVAEISNPVMHFRILLKHLGKRYTKLYEFCEISYICKRL